MSIAALPRPVLLGVVGVVLVGGVFFTTHKPSTTTSSSRPAPAQTPPPRVLDREAGLSAAREHPRHTGSRRRTALRPAPRDPGCRRPCKRALDAHKVVVILFWNRHGVDDRSVKTSVDRLPHPSGGRRSRDRVSHLSRYTRITAAANVRQPRRS